MAEVKTASGYGLEVPTLTRQERLVRARGLITENFPINQTDSTGATATNQTIFITAVGVKPGDVINNILIDIQSAGTGSGCTLAQYALLDYAGNRLATTTDGATSRTQTESVGLKTIPLSAAYTVGNEVLAVYVAVLQNNGTTAAKLAVAGAGNANAAGASISGKFQAAGTAGTSQSSIGTTNTIAATSAINFWAGLS